MARSILLNSAAPRARLATARRLRTPLGAVLVAVLWGASSGAGAEVRLSEILVDPLGEDAGRQVVEISNEGSTPAAIGGWRVVSESDVASLPPSLVLAPGARYLIHLGAEGLNDAVHYYTGSGFAPVHAAAHSLALYANTGALTDPAALRDFVQWGGAGQPREALAAQAGVWTEGDFVPLTSEGNSMQLCGTESATSDAWLEASPTLGATNHCSLDAKSSTWGRVKNIYR